ncbi:MAG TPA: uracil-DNA glycosylase [Alphaproteobacteria bacterium]|nr:uracil-DNA glycosylase [Alphaproteobacteria bacterium]
MTRKKTEEALKWQMEMGVSETFSKKIIKPAKVKPIEASKAEKEIANKRSKDITAQAIKKTVVSPKISNESFDELIKLSRNLADNAKTLEELKTSVMNYDGLAIKKTATNCVFADGNPKSEIMLIGEAPGENEDEQGIPFCGVSGRLLDNMLSYIGHTRADNYYITNTVFWRPPGNRKPTEEEIALCRPFVEKHIALINPKVIVLVGATATYSVLQKEESISSLKKTVHNYHSAYLGRDVPCFAVYHPSYLLRQPSQKKNAWHDFLKIKNFIENV